MPEVYEDAHTVYIHASHADLAKAMLAVLRDVDYDISKEYDPEYEGREDPETNDLKRLVNTFLEAL